MGTKPTATTDCNKQEHANVYSRYCIYCVFGVIASIEFRDCGHCLVGLKLAASLEYFEMKCVCFNVSGIHHCHHFTLPFYVHMCPKLMRSKYDELENIVLFGERARDNTLSSSSCVRGRRCQPFKQAAIMKCTCIGWCMFILPTYVYTIHTQKHILFCNYILWSVRS